jgi:hypothetical protein
VFVSRISELLEENHSLRADIAANARYVEIGKRRVEALERAKAKKRKPADEWGPWFAGTGERPASVDHKESLQWRCDEDDHDFASKMACDCTWSELLQYRLRADHPFYKS